MIVTACQHENCHKHGKDRQGHPRLKCSLCGKTFVDKPESPLGAMRTDIKQAATAISLLLEGMSIRSVQRVTGLCRQTLADLILTVGNNCERLMNSLRDIEVEDVQADEIWSFVGCKEKTRQANGYGEEYGDSWTFLGIERNTKMVLAYEIGGRDRETTVRFLEKLDRATAGRFQLSTDGLSTYTNNVPFTFGNRVDYGQIVKNYASTQTQTRYSPATIINSEKKAVYGNPKQENVCTSHIESFNQKYRMHLRRFTRLTNAHSKSLEHHKAMQAIYLCYYNFARKHDSLGETPAMAAGLTEKAWGVGELLINAAN